MASTRLADRMLTHMVARIESTVVKERPYPHFWTQHIFPADVYDQLMKQFPPVAAFEPVHARHSNSDGTSNRNQLFLTNVGLEKLSGATRELWNAVAEVTVSEELKQAVYRCLSPGLAFRYGVSTAEVPSLPGHARPRIYYERCGYSIPPHPDTRKKVVTFQFAFPETEQDADLGTGVYVRSLSPFDWTGKAKGFRGFRKVQQYPFLPNTAFAFVVLNTVTKRSWHGREPLEGTHRIRRSLLNVYYERADHVERPDEDYVPERRQAA